MTGPTSSAFAAWEARQHEGQPGAVNVLLVDANPASSALLESALSGLGHQVQAVGDADAALSAVRAGSPQVVVVGCSVAGMEQTALCRSVIERASSVRPVLLAIPASDRTEDALALIETGVDDCLPWSLDRVELDRRLAIAFARAERGQRLAGALRRTEDRYRQMYENANDIIYTHDAAGRFTSFNRMAEKITGYSREELSGISVAGLVAADHLALALDMTRRKLAGETESTSYEIDIISKDGYRVPVEVSTRLLHQDGEAVSILGIARDISERKRAEEALRASEQRFRSLVQNGFDIVTISDADGTLRYASASVERLMGYSPGGWQGRNILSFIHPDDLAAGRNGFANAVANPGSRSPIELRILHRDGSWRWVETVACNLLDDPAVRGIVHNTRDITERKRAEDALRESEADLRAVFASTLDSIMLIAPDYRILGFNRAAEENLRNVYGDEPAVGQSLLPFMRADGRGTFTAAFQLALAGESAEYEREIAGLDGSLYWYQVTLTPVRFDDGSIRGVAVVSRDITERKRAEEALRQSERRRRRIIDGMFAFVSLYDREGVMLETNQHTLDLWGLAREEMIGRRPWETERWAHDGEGRERIRAAFRRAAAGQRIRGDLTTGVGDKVIVTDATLQPLYDEQGQVHQILSFAVDITDRKQAEEALRAAEERLRQAVRVSQIGIFDHDHQSDTIYWSPEQRAIYGWGPDEPVTLSAFLACVHEKDRETIAAAVRNAHDPTGDGLYDVEHRIIRRDSEIRWLVTRSQTLFEGHGNVRHPVRTIGAIVDITDRRRADEARRLAEQHLQTVATNAPIILYALDPDGVYTLSEGKGLETLGFRPGQAVGLSAYTLHSARDQGIRRIRAALAGEPDGLAPFEYEQDGRVFESKLEPLRDASGSITGAVGVAVDVTERRRAEEARRAAEERLLTIASRAPLVLSALDATGAYTLSEGAGLSALGLKPGEIVGRSFVDVWAGEPDIVENIRRCLAGEEFVAEVSVRGLEYESRYTPLRDAAGVVTGTIVVSIDVTEQRRTQQAFLQAQKLESLGVLAGGIAHDFNNLLVGILGNAGLALGELPQHSPARETIREIEVAGQRAADLARQMLAYSGKGRFVVEPINLNELVEEMTHLLRVSIAKGALLRFELSSTLPAIEGDATQVRQVVMNLVINASDAIDEGNGVITISTGVTFADRSYLAEPHVAPDLPEGNYVYLEVTDTGAGMDAETRSKIFDPFFTTKFTGRGLGLAAVLGIIRGHHGAIKVQSEPGKGSSFRVLLPASSFTTQSDAVRPAAKNWNATGTILVIDDEPTVRAVTARALGLVGFTVLTASDGREGVEVFRAHAQEIACVLLDMTMPRLNGEQAFSEIRLIRPDARVILLSGYNEPEATGRFAGKGLAGFVQKPYDIATLRDEVRRVLES